MLYFSLFILGLTSLVAQVIIARELMVSFYGNEFFIGWILFAWLFWVGMGSIIPKFFKNFPAGLPLLVSCHLLAVSLLPLEIILIRLSKIFTTVSAGQIPDFLPATAVSFLIMAPLCLVLGLQFTVAVQCRIQLSAEADKGHSAGKAYTVESAGFVFGGPVFS